MVTEAGEKAKLLAVMVMVAVAGGAVVVVAIVVVVAAVVVGDRVVVVVGARVVVVGAVVVDVVVVEGRVLVVVVGSEVAVVDEATVVLGREVVVDGRSVTETSGETPAWHASSSKVNATRRPLRIPGHTQEARCRFASRKACETRKGSPKGAFSSELSSVSRRRSRPPERGREDRHARAVRHGRAGRLALRLPLRNQRARADHS